MGNCSSRKKIGAKTFKDGDEEDIILNDDVVTYYDGSFFKPKCYTDSVNIEKDDEDEEEELSESPLSEIDISMPDMIPLENTTWKNSMDPIEEESKIELSEDNGAYDSASQSANDGEEVIPNRLAKFDSDSMSPPRSKFQKWFYGKDGKFIDFEWSLRSILLTSPSSDIIASPTE